MAAKVKELLLVVWNYGLPELEGVVNSGLLYLFSLADSTMHLHNS